MVSAEEVQLHIHIYLGCEAGAFALRRRAERTIFNRWGDPRRGLDASISYRRVGNILSVEQRRLLKRD